MLCIDCEMTGLDPLKHSIISIGAVDISHPERTFYGECRAFDGAILDPEGLAVNGFSEEDCLNPEKQSLTELMTKLHSWIMESDEHTLVGQNVYMDKEFLNNSFKRAEISFQFNHRVVDTHSIAYAEFLKLGKQIPYHLLPNGVKKSALNLDTILRFVGIPEEPRPHNALTGAKVSAEAFYRLVFKKKLLPEFTQYNLPTF